MWRGRSFLWKSALIPLGVASYAVILDEKAKKDTTLMLESCFRVARLGFVVSQVALDYKLNFDSNSSELKDLQDRLKFLQGAQEEYTYALWDAKSDHERDMWNNQIRSTRNELDTIAIEIANLKANHYSSASTMQINQEIHKRSARKLREMCMANRGLYIKLGQHIAVLDHIIPEEYQEELFHLFANNECSSIESVRRVFHEDFGVFPEEMFDYFETTPIATASLAQVHRAKDKNGKMFAVKVQHEHLLESSNVDRKAVTFIVELLSKAFKKFDYNWLTREMNMNLPRELDFNEELRNTEKARQQLSGLIDSGDVAIPDVFPALSSKRVLVMSFEEGFYVSDKEKMEANNIDKSKLSSIISSVFFEQIFRHGFVHCDPHEANLLVRPNPLNPSKPQLVLLDHGLYRELKDDFRRDYCYLWREIICGNKEGIHEYATRMNVGELFTLLAAMLTMKSWDDIISKDLKKMKLTNHSSENVQLQAYAERYLDQINYILGKVPSDMLLLLKTNDCLRHIDRRLNTPINTISVAADIASSVIFEEDISVSHSWSDWYRSYSRYFEIQNRLLVLKAWNWFDQYFKSK